MTSPTYCVDLTKGEVANFTGSGLATLTERHYVKAIGSQSEPTSIQPGSVKQSAGHDVILILHAGLPDAAEIDFSKSVLRRGGRVYFHWPDESAIEIVTTERLRSFRRHRAAVEIYSRWRTRSERREPRPSQQAEVTVVMPEVSRGAERAAVTAEAANPARTAGKVGEFLIRDGDTYRVQGRGMYIRLDYWAKLKGGGSYGHTCYQAKALRKICSDGLICVTASPFALLNEFEIDQIVLPSRTPLSDEFSLVENGAAYEGVIEELIRLYQPKFVFQRLVLGNPSVARACQRLGVPHIAEFNGSELTMSKIFGGREMGNAEVLQSIETESFRQADVICTVSEPVKDMVTGLGIPDDKILVNPNGVDLEAYGPLPAADRTALRETLGFGPQDVVVGFCGTFGGWHGIEVLAEALPQICAERSSVKFLLIGDGNFKHLIKAAIAEHALEARIKDVGMVPQQDAARLLAACDILLSPHSKNMGDKPFFGSPTKLFEYMAYGAGIVCSDLVQLGEVMRPALTLADRSSRKPANEARAILVEPASVAQLVAATLWLIDDPDLRTALGRNAQAAAAAYYSWDIHVQSLWRFASGEAPIGYHLDRRIL